jgi:hypothetical protein
VLLGGTIGAAVPPRIFAGWTSTAPESPIAVRFADVRESAKIAFQQDSTQTGEKYYLETIGTGVGWIDYDQDGPDGFIFRAIGRDRHLQTAPSTALRALP